MPTITATNTSHECPSNDDLQKLVRDRLPAHENDEVTDHVGSCSGCQSRLELVATDGDVKFSGSFRSILTAEPPKESAYWKAISRAENLLDITIGHEQNGDKPRSGELKLDFLQPTNTPNRIGRIGAFEVVRVVGRGGMGVVLHAIDASLQRDVAVKVLDPLLANDELARQRFCREARAAAAVTHDNIVAVYQVNEDDRSGLPYMVMQLVNGETLEERLTRVTKLSVTEAVNFGMQAAAGLASAHAAKLIHRDIKPANIMIETGTDKVVLTDFGLARAAEDLKLTRTGFVAGTPLYMAPEQARGDDVDHRSDLFSLGSVMYESLAGQPPFAGKTPLAVLRRLSDEAHVPLHTLNPEVPSWLEDVIDRLLAKDPNKRIQSAAELAEILSAQYVCLQPAEHAAKPDVCILSLTAAKFRAKRRSHRVQLAGLLAVPFLLGTVAGAAGFYAFGPTREVTVEVAGPPVAAGQTGPKAIAIYESKSGAVWTVSASKDSNRIAMGMEDGTVVLWQVNPNKTLETIEAHSGPVWTVDLSADGNTLVTASDDGKIKMWDVSVKAEIKLELDNEGSVKSAALNAAGNMIVTGDRMGNVKIWDIRDLSVKKPAKTFKHAGVINGVAFSPDDETIASISSNKETILWEVKTGREQVKLKGHSGPVYGVSFSRDDAVGLVATASWDHTVRIYKVSNGEFVRTIDTGGEGLWSVAFSCCGRILATAGQDGLIKLWDVDTGKEMERFTRHDSTVHAVRFTPDGKSLVSGGRDGTVRIWKIK